MGTGQEGVDAAEVDRKAAFDAPDDLAVHGLFFLEELVHLDPSFFAARFIARENSLAERVFDTL